MKPSALLAVVGLAVGLAPVPLGAQGRWTVTPALTVAERYDDNIFGTANRTSDFITRIIPELKLTYESAPLDMAAAYSITGELYADTSQLDNFGENQTALLTLGYRPDPRLNLGLAGYFARSNDPTTFPVQAAAPAGTTVLPTIGVKRQEANQLTLSTSAGYQFDPRWSGTATYNFTAVDQRGVPNSRSQTGQLGAAYRLTPQDQPFVTAEVSEFDSTTSVTSGSLLLGWSRLWSQDLSTSVALGPRLTDGAWDAAARASLRYIVLRELSASVAYSFGPSLAVGAIGAQEVSDVSVALTYQPIRDLQLTASGGWVRSSPVGGVSANSTTNTYTAGASASYPVTDWLSATLAYQFSLTDGLHGGTVQDNQVTVGLTIRYPYRF